MTAENRVKDKVMTSKSSFRSYRSFDMQRALFWEQNPRISNIVPEFLNDSQADLIKQMLKFNLYLISVPSGYEFQNIR